MRLLIKIFEGQTVDLFTDLFSQIVGHILRNACHEPSLNIGEDHGQNIDQREGAQNGEDVIKVYGSAVGILCDKTFCQCCSSRSKDLRSDDGEDRGCDRKDNNDCQLKSIRAKVMKQFDNSAAEILGLVTCHHATAARTAVLTGTFRSTHASSSSLN